MIKAKLINQLIIYNLKGATKTSLPHRVFIPYQNSKREKELGFKQNFSHWIKEMTLDLHSCFTNLDYCLLVSKVNKKFNVHVGMDEVALARKAAFASITCTFLMYPQQQPLDL